jgi:spermidine synthase
MDDSLIQNTYDPVRRQSVSHFTYMLSGLAQAYTAEIKDVLCIGLGAGIVPMEFANQGASVDVVEINPAILPVATNYFGVDATKFSLYLGDGRQYLNRSAKQYDGVVLDVFLGDSSPSHLLTREAFDSIRKVLRPQGVLVINSFAQLGEDKDFFAASIGKTLKSVFTSVRMHTSDRGEMFYVASSRPELAFVRQPDTSNVHPQVRRFADAAYQSHVEIPTRSGLVLRDDYNPAEFYDAQNRQEYRKSMAFAVKNNM